MDDVALFPLHTVLFPGARLPLRLFEQRYLAMAKACLRDGLPFGVCLIREGREVGAPATPAGVGTLARIAEWDMSQLGLLEVVARGGERFRIVARRVEPDGLARASVEVLAEPPDAPVPPECAGCAELLRRIAAEYPDLVEPPHQFESSAWVGARLASILPLPLEAKQALLETDVPLERLKSLQDLLGRQGARRGG